MAERNYKLWEPSQKRSGGYRVSTIDEESPLNGPLQGTIEACSTDDSMRSNESTWSQKIKAADKILQRQEVGIRVFEPKKSPHATSRSNLYEKPRPGCPALPAANLSNP